MAGYLAIGDVAARTGVSSSALRFYESCGLIASLRSRGGQRRYTREVLRRVAFIRIAQQVGLSLEDVAQALSLLPEQRTPKAADWARLSATWTADLDRRISLLQALRAQLSSCIGCGCLSLEKCALYNPSDGAARFGSGPRYLLGNSSADVVGEEEPLAKANPGG